MKNPLTSHLPVLIASIAAFAVATGMYAYLYHDTLVLTDHAIVAMNAAADEAVRERQSKDIKNLADSSSESRAKLASLFVPEDDAVAFIQSMESIGNASGADISISSISEAQADSTKKMVTGSVMADIKVKGSWSEVMKSIELFELLPYRVKIDRLAMDVAVPAGDRVSTSKVWQASFNISAPTLK